MRQAIRVRRLCCVRAKASAVPRRFSDASPLLASNSTAVAGFVNARSEQHSGRPDGYQNNPKKPAELVLFGGLAAAAASAVAANGTTCENSSESAPKEESVKSVSLWPDGVDESQVDLLVEEVLKDPSLNSPIIPDTIERQLYKSTIQITLNMAYYLIAGADDMELLAHKVHITRKKVREDDPSVSSVLSSRPNGDGQEINEEILEEVAHRLLQNKAINLTFVPDDLERLVYVNCLKVFFRTMTLISKSICITMCGHQVRLHIEPMETKKAIEKALARSSSLSDVDMDRMYKFARDAGVNDEDLVDAPWWSRLFIRRELLAHLHASLYSLMLGIADDIMANTKICIMSDELGFEVKPDERYDPETKTRRKDKDENHEKEVKNRDERIKYLEEKQRENEEGESVGAFGVVTFLVGVGVGVSVTALSMVIRK